MRIGVPKEIKNHEYRVGLVPASVREAVGHGHAVVVETGAAARIGFTDNDYRKAGATIAASASEVFSTADLIVKVKEPQLGECGMLRQGQTLFTYLHLAPDPAQAKALMKSGATAIAYETVTSPRGGLPLLSPMSEVAGRMAIGGFRQYAATQEQGEGFFCIVDLHAITVDHDPEELREGTLDMAAMLFATGLDPARSTVFVQSHVTAHSEAAWLLGGVTAYGQLGRMTQFKEKRELADFVSAALFDYPVLMSGDILLPDRRGADWRRPAPAPRALSRRRAALRLPLRRDVRAARGRLSRGRRPRHGSPGADEEDVEVVRDQAGEDPDARRRGHGDAEGQARRRRLRTRGAPRPGREARDLELDRAHDRRDGRDDRRGRGPLRRRGLRGVQGRRREGAGRAPRTDPGAVSRASLGPTELARLLAVGAEKAGAASAPTLLAMYERMGFVPPS